MSSQDDDNDDVNNTKLSFPEWTVQNVQYLLDQIQSLQHQLQRERQIRSDIQEDVDIMHREIQRLKTTKLKKIKSIKPLP